MWDLLVVDKIDSRRPYFDLTVKMAAANVLSAHHLDPALATEILEENSSLIEKFYSEALIKELEIYDNYYTKEEVATLINFSRTTAGIKASRLIAENQKMAATWLDMFEKTMEALSSSANKIRTNLKT